MLFYLTGGTQTTDAAPGVLALLHTVIRVMRAQTWHLRMMDGRASRIRALALRRRPLRPGALPFLHRALVLLASLAMLPCTSAADVWWTTGTGCTDANEQHGTSSGTLCSQCAARCEAIVPGTGASPSSSRRGLAPIANSRPFAIQDGESDQCMLSYLVLPCAIHGILGNYTTPRCSCTYCKWLLASTHKCSI